MRDGTTLLETLLVVLTLGVLVGITVPPLGRFADRAAVLAAREELIGRVVQARALAAEAGGATLVVQPARAAALVIVEGDTVALAPLSAGDDGVRLRPDREAELDFDAMGLGRFASATFRLERGSATASVVISSYGRPARR